jgi:hypothetical protein
MHTTKRVVTSSLVAMAVVVLTGCCAARNELPALRRDLGTLRYEVKASLESQEKQSKALNKGFDDVKNFLKNRALQSGPNPGNGGAVVTPVPPIPEPDPVVITPDPVVIPDDPSVGPKAVVKLKGAMTMAEKQKVVKTALLNLQRCFVSAEKDMSEARDVLVTALAEPGFNVVQAAKDMKFDPTEDALDKFRADNNCNLVFLLKGEAKQKDKFGTFFSYECKLSGKILNLYTHQIIARKTITQRGARKQDADQAAESAVVAAAEPMGEYLIKEVARKWQATSLLKAKLEIHDVEDAGVCNDLRAGLQNRVGVYYVSLERWDVGGRTAEFEVLCRFDVKEHLLAYVNELRLDKIKPILAKGGEVFTAIRKPDLED